VHITVAVKDGVALIKISGRMIFDESLFLLRRHVRELLASGILRYVVDISEAPYLDSSACGEVIGMYSSITKAQGSLAFVNPNARVRTLWKRIRIIEILNIFDSLDEAMKFVQTPR
jgi:anti-anti-sigma factor